MKKKQLKTTLKIIFVVALLFIITTPSNIFAISKGPIVVGSKLDMEGKLLGQMISLSLEQAGFKIVDHTGTGTTNVVRKALLESKLDVYPEYTGTAISNFFVGQKINEATAKNANLSYATVKALDKKLNNIEWLGRAPANNSFAIAVRLDLNDGAIKTLTDLANYQNNGGELKIAGSQEFFERQDAMKSFEKTYGFELSDEQKIVLPGATTNQTELAAVQGTNGANAAMAYGTDGTIAALGLQVLEDPKGAQIVYQAAPIVRGKFYQNYPEMAKILNPIFKSLNLEVLQQLNSQMTLDARTPQDVARSYLKSNGFLR